MPAAIFVNTTVMCDSYARIKFFERIEWMMCLNALMMMFRPRCLIEDGLDVDIAYALKCLDDNELERLMYANTFKVSDLSITMAIPTPVFNSPPCEYVRLPQPSSTPPSLSYLHKRSSSPNILATMLRIYEPPSSSSS